MESDSTAICAWRSCARRSRGDYERIESRRNYCEHRSFQTAKRNGGDDQQRSGAEPAGQSEPSGLVRQMTKHERRMTKCWSRLAPEPEGATRASHPQSGLEIFA